MGNSAPRKPFRRDRYGIPAALLTMAAVASALLVSVVVAIAQNAPLPAPESAAAARWQSGPLSKVRLLAGQWRQGRAVAAIEIELEGKAHTYWRMPGDGGVPPVLDVSRSKNLQSFTVIWPAPVRFTDSGMDTFGYEERVIFPLEIVPQDVSKPVHLRLALDYAACEKICVPGKAALEITLDPRLKAPGASARIAHFAARAPVEMTGPDTPSIALEATDNPKIWRARVTPPGAPPAAASARGFADDLFAEGPDGWIFDTKPAVGGGYDVILAERPASATRWPELRLTLTGPSGAFETRARPAGALPPQKP